VTTSPICVAFRHVTGRAFWSRLIHVVAGPPVHCVFVFASGVAYHSTQGAGVERFYLSPERIAAEGWELVPVEGVDPQRLRAWCEERLGMRYDTIGAVLYCSPLTSRDRWTCSEFNAEGLVACGAEVSLLRWSQTPRRLRQALRARLLRTITARPRLVA
jgi:hypothetical protein